MYINNYLKLAEIVALIYLYSYWLVEEDFYIPSNKSSLSEK